MQNDQSRRNNPNAPSGGATEPVVVTSTANASIRTLIRLRDNNRARRRAQCVIIDGQRLVERAIEIGLIPIMLFVDQNRASGLAERFSGLPLTLVSPDIVRHIAFGQTESAIVGHFSLTTDTIESLRLPPSGLVMVADRVEKPGNIGAIYRTADAAGTHAMILCGGGDRSHPSAVRNSQAASLAIPTAIADQDAALQRLSAAGYQMLAARVESSQAYDDIDFTRPTAIIVGNEADGLADRWQDPRIIGVHIPMAGHVDSLNVSVTAAVLMMEAARQRRAMERQRNEITLL